jgi:hypothetical protein
MSTSSTRTAMASAPPPHTTHDRPISKRKRLTQSSHPRPHTEWVHPCSNATQRSMWWIALTSSWLAFLTLQPSHSTLSIPSNRPTSPQRSFLQSLCTSYPTSSYPVLRRYQYRASTLQRVPVLSFWDALGCRWRWFRVLSSESGCLGHVQGSLACGDWSLPRLHLGVMLLVAGMG